MRRLSRRDALAATYPPRPLARERSTPPGSGPPANRGTARSARPAAAAGREFVEHAAQLAGAAHLARRIESPGISQIIEPTTGWKPESPRPSRNSVASRLGQ